MNKVFLFALVGFFSLQIHALPIPKLGTDPRLTLQIPQGFTADYNFEGIVSLSGCSGSLIQFENARDNDRAMVLTNGHCVESGSTAPGKFLYGVKSKRSFELLKANGTDGGRVTADLIIYSTMTKTDITIYRLKETYAEIRTKFGIRPMMLSSQHPELQKPIEVVSGFWRKGYSCSIEAFITHLKEDKWTWDDAIRYSRPGCEVIGGTSGSPVVTPGTRTVIGINNTGNDNGERCTMDNPCEVDKDGNITFKKGYSYGEQTYWVYSCLNQNNELDLAKEGCQLPH